MEHVKNMNFEFVRDDKGRFEYTTKWNDEVLKDLTNNAASLYFCGKPSWTDDKKKGFAAVLMVCGRQVALEIAGIDVEGGNYRGYLRGFIILLNELQKKAPDFHGCVYVDNNYIWKMVSDNWGRVWMQNGYVKRDGKQVMNKDLIKPIAEVLYTENMRSAMTEINNIKFTKGESDYSVKCAVTMTNQLAKEYANAL